MATHGCTALTGTPELWAWKERGLLLTTVGLKAEVWGCSSFCKGWAQWLSCTICLAAEYWEGKAQPCGVGHEEPRCRQACH